MAKGQDQRGVMVKRDVLKRLKILSAELEVPMGQIIAWAVGKIEKDLKLANVNYIKKKGGKS